MIAIPLLANSLVMVLLVQLPHVVGLVVWAVEVAQISLCNQHVICWVASLWGLARLVEVSLAMVGAALHLRVVKLFLRVLASVWAVPSTARVPHALAIHVSLEYVAWIVVRVLKQLKVDVII